MRGAGIIALLWRRGRVVEGTPLLREHLVKNRIQGSNPCVSAKNIGKTGH
jgi:hypothetical protein